MELSTMQRDNTGTPQSASPQRANRPHVNWWGLGCVVLFAGLLSQTAMAEQPFPNRPVRFVVAFSPGGITDIIARLVGEKLSDRLHQSVYIDNKGGGAGAIGAKFVTAAEPDGYTLLVTTTAIAIGSAAAPTAVNPASELTPIALIASSPTLLAVKAPTAANNLMEFILAHKNKPGPLTYSSAGTGTTEHLTAAYVLKDIPGIDAVHIPFRSGAESVNAVLGEHVDIASTPSATALALLQDKKLKPLAVASHKRVAMFPDVPTLAENGLVDVDNASWIALFGPPNMPPALVQTLSTAVADVLQNPALEKRETEMGFNVQEMAQPELAEFMHKEVVKWGNILKATGITLE
jgi:tripartite-type tricarboxylate transporter receptor subunit TctC